mmetsp:Transcript_1332/g.1797  ORF Transcript_1332/g.1797 Transcript_1332/m.1797 type:complete len:750 (+) Transcript_1332:250-2499(+)
MNLKFNDQKSAITTIVTTMMMIQVLRLQKNVACAFANHQRRTVTNNAAAFSSSSIMSRSENSMIQKKNMEQMQQQQQHGIFLSMSTEQPYSSSSSNSDSNDSFSILSSKEDTSYLSKSRIPFTSPKSAYDDSIPQNSASSSSSPDISWSKLGLTLELAQLLTNPTTKNGMGFGDGPTPIQQMAIPAILSGSSSASRKQSIAFAAATGSGKTLAYLLPLIQALKAQEMLYQSTDTAENGKDGYWRGKPKRPRALILAPTRELTMQIASVLKSLSHHVKLSTTSLVGGEDLGKQRKRLNRPLDILVSTPGRLVKHWDDGSVFLGSVDFVVIDEVDTMLEQGFQNDIGKVLHPLLYKHKGAFQNDVDLEQIDLVEGAPQVILTSATMTNAVKRLLRDESLPPTKRGSKDQIPTKQNDVKILLPKNMRVLTAPGLHRAVPRLKQVFIDVGNADKLSLLVDLVANSGSGGAGSVLSSRDKQSGDSAGLTLVFCNTVSSCRAVQHGLTESGIESLSYHGELNSLARAESLKIFRQAGKAMCDEEDKEELSDENSANVDDDNDDDEIDDININMDNRHPNHRKHTTRSSTRHSIHIPFFPSFYVMNPVSVVYDIIDEKGSDYYGSGYHHNNGSTRSGSNCIFTSTAYSTLQGHWLCGEERVSVIYRSPFINIQHQHQRQQRQQQPYLDIDDNNNDDDDNVVDIEIVSYSRPSSTSLIGKLIFPFIDKMQDEFFRNELDALEDIARKANKGSTKPMI